jgi:RND family efflux transporter MFP subunit
MKLSYPALLLIGLFWGCAREEASPGIGTEREVVLGPESVFRVHRERIETGPILSGTLEPKERAMVRAELAGQVTATSAEVGQRVRRGQLLARMESDPVRQSVISAESALRTAEQAVATAQRNAERAAELEAAGAVAQQAVEAARLEVASAEAQLANSRSQLAAARESLEDTVVRAPIDGIVSEKAIAEGDVVQPGAPLFTIVDLSTLQLEADVPSTAIGSLELGAPVEFHIAGYADRTFIGELVRMSPVADPDTQQLTLFVSIPNRDALLVGGLFSEGRLVSEAREALVVPMNALDGASTSPSVLRISEGRVERVAVDLGIQDERSELVEVRAGLAENDRVLAGPSRDILPGTAVVVSEEVEASEGPRAPSTGSW